ncbi:hypothetical protein [Couchioplanes caeruleus]|nr:hypothetical protein [Couchioplanes caeruleus]
MPKRRSCTPLGDIAVLKERRAGVSYPLPLRELRRRAQYREVTT